MDLCREAGFHDITEWTTCAEGACPSDSITEDNRGRGNDSFYHDTADFSLGSQSTAEGTAAESMDL